MKAQFLEVLRCPKTGQKLLVEGVAPEGQWEEGWLVSEDGSHRYPIRDGIPRFVPASNYADNFGFQWNHFSKTQLDRHSGLSISADRFWKATGWNRADISGAWILDAGCGSGRFAEIALDAGANVVALDYSSAVEACRNNLRASPNLHVVQGDIYALPFAPHTFQYVYSLGVLQHTPDVRSAFAALPAMLENNGRLCVDFYEKSYKNWLLPKYYLRVITRHLPKAKLFALLQHSVPPLLSMSRSLARVPWLGPYLRRLIPVANYEGVFPLNEKQLREWAILDTFDWLSPTFDQPQTASTIRNWLSDAGLKNIEVLKAGHLVGRASK